MDKEFKFYIISSSGNILEKSCILLSLILVDGEIGIMKDHEDLIAPFEAQNLRYITKENCGYEVKISHGIIQIESGIVKLLVDSFTDL